MAGRAGRAAEVHHAGRRKPMTHPVMPLGRLDETQHPQRMEI